MPNVCMNCAASTAAETGREVWISDSHIAIVVPDLPDAEMAALVAIQTVMDRDLSDHARARIAQWVRSRYGIVP